MEPDPARRKPSVPHPRILPTRLAIDPTAFVAPGAILRGDVTLGARSSVWYGAVLRGDLAPVAVGDDTNVQDGAILHVETGGPATLGRRVTVGHRAVVHACTVEDDCLIAIGAIVLSGARVGRHSIIGAGALVKEGWDVPPLSLVLGVPGRIVRQVTGEEMERVARNWEVYVAYAEQHKIAEGRDGR
ncbi:MAG TPA: gamma carbonic anhydrase family protein [Candidatus Polarisedimenticolia bacterium]|nr:gamma carbonic anhydrase family protein [Candidatus Polarisedimenticolia bacterium]